MPLIIDAHCDLAWNMLNFGRDYTRPAAETREKEKGTLAPKKNGDSLIGWSDYQRGQVAMVFSTLFASPARASEGRGDRNPGSGGNRKRMGRTRCGAIRRSTSRSFSASRTSRKA